MHYHAHQGQFRILASFCTLPLHFFSYPIYFNPIRIYFLSHSGQTSRQSHLPSVHHPNDIWWALHLVRSSLCNSVQPPLNFLPLNSKCALQYPVLGHPQSPVHLQCDRPCDKICTYFHRSWKTINKQHCCSRMKISPLLLLLTLLLRCPSQKRLHQEQQRGDFCMVRPIGTLCCAGRDLWTPRFP